MLAPLAVLLLSLLPKLGSLRLPTNPQEALAALIFQGSIWGMMALYFVYWVQLSIFQVFAGVSVLLVVALFSGHRALRMLNARQGGVKTKKD